MARWIDDILQAIRSLGGKAAYTDLYNEVARIRGENLPKTWQAIIRNQVESFSSDSENYRKHREDLFYSIGGLGSGIWGLREQKFSHNLDLLNANVFNNTIEEPVAKYEGAVRRITLDKYERDMNLRQQCLDYWGFDCVVCGINFEQVYGSLGRGYIHVHHLEPLAERPGPRLVDPIRDLRPVCPNCHAMLHRRTPPLPVEELRNILFEK